MFIQLKCKNKQLSLYHANLFPSLINSKIICIPKSGSKINILFIVNCFICMPVLYTWGCLVRPVLKDQFACVHNQKDISAMGTLLPSTEGHFSHGHPPTQHGRKTVRLALQNTNSLPMPGMRNEG